MYTYLALDPRPDARESAVAQCGPSTLGIEVTVPELAAACGLGNIDPQHSGGQTNVAACQAALTAPIPPAGASLATVRADADSILAMAVLTARASGLPIDTGLVNRVGAADSAPDGPWRRDYTPPDEFAACNAVAMDHRRPLDERVSLLVDVLTGKAALPPTQPADYSAVRVSVGADGRYAVALADGPAGRGAIAAGYRVAPVVIATNETFSVGGLPPHRKHTVARWNAGHPMDWDGMLTELRKVEPGWGGSSSICGSPQGVASALTTEQVVEIVERHLI